MQTSAEDPKKAAVKAPGKLPLAAAFTCIAAAALVFILPLYVPIKPIQTVSASYIAGFNNSVAVLTSVALSGLVFLLTLSANRREPAPPPNFPSQKLTVPFIAAVLAASALVLSVAGCLVAASHYRYLGDAGYLIEQATVHRDTGRALYTQLEFAYGPLLLLPEIWLSRLLHSSITTAYFITLVLESTLGLLMLAWILNELPIRTSLRKAALILLAFGAITPHLGLNYTFFRFLSPLAVLLFATRQRSPWRVVLLLSLGEALELLISPELGLAMAIGVLTFGFFNAWQQGWRWLAAAIIPVAVLTTLLSTLGRPYLKMAASFSRGALALPVGPYPHILVLLFALVWLVPLGLGRLLRPHDATSPRLLAFYAASVALLPAALGRCDPLHIIFNGIGILILSLILLSNASRNQRRAWVAAIAVLVCWNHFVNERLFEERTAEVLRQTVMYRLPPPIRKPAAKILARGHAFIHSVLSSPPIPEYHLDPTFDRIVGSDPVVTPLDVSLTVEEDLKRTHHYTPTFYAFWVDMMNPTAEQRSIDDTNRYPWLLLPTDFAPGGQQMPEGIAIFQGLRLPYRQRNPIPYNPGEAFAANLKQNWTPTQTFDRYTLYRRNPAISSISNHP